MKFWEWLKSLFTARKPADVIPIRPIENVSPVKIRGEYSEHPWLEAGLRDLGKCEGKNDAWIINLFKATTYATNSSQTPWCAAWVCSKLHDAGYISTRSAAANANKSLGANCPQVPGAILVWQHLSGPLKGRFHTNMLVETMPGGLKCVGGNQHNAVNIADYMFKDHKLVSCRWPIKLGVKS